MSLSAFVIHQQGAAEKLVRMGKEDLKLFWFENGTRFKAWGGGINSKRGDADLGHD